MNTLQIINEQQPIHIIHDMYKRECRYTRGVHISVSDFAQILEAMNQEQKHFFDFHNVAKKIEAGTLLNGYAGLAKQIASFYREQNIEIAGLNNGKDFYVKLT